jgi:hypothetical protein
MFRPGAIIEKLLRKVQAATANVRGAKASLKQRRNEIRGYIIFNGIPHIFLTVNPADVHNPLILFIGGENITQNIIDKSNESIYYRSKFVQKNPVLQAIYFDMIIKYLLSELLGWPNKKGILGNCNY